MQGARHHRPALPECGAFRTLVEAHLHDFHFSAVNLRDCKATSLCFCRPVMLLASGRWFVSGPTCPGNRR